MVVKGHKVIRSEKTFTIQVTHYNTIQYNTIQCLYRTVQRILFVPIYRLSDEKVAALSQFSFKLVKFY